MNSQFSYFHAHLNTLLSITLIKINKVLMNPILNDDDVDELSRKKDKRVKWKKKS